MSQEHLSYSLPQPDSSKSPEVPQQYLAIFIDDILTFSENWAETFRSPNLRLRISPSKEDRLAHFYQKFSDADLSQVVLVIVDQGFGGGETRNFIHRVRTANPDVFILETTGGLEKKKFAESDAVFQNTSEQFPVRRLIKESKGNIFLKIEKLKLYSSPLRRKAQLADPYSELNRLYDNDEEFDVQESFSHLTQLPMFHSILLVLGLEYKAFWKKFQFFSFDQKRDALHNLWNLAMILTEHSHEDDVGLTVQRILEMFRT